jgi:hypothetical protein
VKRSWLLQPFSHGLLATALGAFSLGLLLLKATS